MGAFRLFLVLMLSFALPFQGYALAGTRACTMSHAPMERHSIEASVTSEILVHKQAHEHTHSQAHLDTHQVSHDHANHAASDNACQCSASCIGTGLISSHNLIQLEQVRPVFSEVHSQSLLQAPSKRLDRPPRHTAA